MHKTWTVARRDLSLALIVVLSIALGFSIAANYHRVASPAVAAGPKIAADWKDAFIVIAENLSPSVVNITSEKMVERPSMPNFDDFFNFPFGGNRGRRAPESEKELQKATGSGVIVRADGYIMTNNHVVAGADHVTVKLADGREFAGKVLRDPYSDLALVKIDAKDLPAVQFAESDKVKVGQWVAAIGSPFGLRNTMTVGIVSGVRQASGNDEPLPKAEVIQTDASINPGNSGGPLVDLDGRIVGINFAIYSTSGGSVGVGFAIPANVAKNVMTQLIEKGKIVRGYLGVSPKDLTPLLQEKLGTKQGAVIESIEKDSPGEKGGLKVTDVVVNVGGKPVTNSTDLRRIVQGYPPNAEVKVVVIRDKAEKTLTIKLGELPTEGEEASTEGGDKVGISVQPLTSDLAKQLNIDESVKGVVVRKVESGGAADRAGISEGDVITEIDDAPIASVAQYSKAVAKLKSGETVIVVVQRGERSTIIEMRIE